MPQPDAEAFFAVFEEEERLRELVNERRYVDYRVSSGDGVTTIDELGLAAKASAQNDAQDQISDVELTPEQLELRNHRRKGYGDFIGRMIAVTALEGCKPFIRVAWNDANSVKSIRSDANCEPLFGTLAVPPWHSQRLAFYMRSENLSRGTYLSPLFRHKGLLEVRPLTPKFDETSRQIEVEFLN